MIELEVKGVSKRFGGLWALKSVDITLNKGEILGLIGPNGAGKTTLFNVITGLYKPESGKVIFEGHDITGLPPYKIARLGISRTFQITRPFRELTVLDNVIAGCLMNYRTYEEAMSHALEVLEITGLINKKDEVAGELNVLEQKRLELARALATNPKLLLLDEVAAGLKPKEIDEILEISVSYTHLTLPTN